MGNYSRPWENKIVPARKRWVFPGASARAACLDTMFNPISGRMTSRTVVAGGKGTAKGFYESAALELTGPALETALLTLEEALPHLLLEQAKRHRLTLRYAGAWSDGATSYDIVTYATGPTRLVTLFIDAGTRLLTRVEKLGYAPGYGDMVGVIAFGDFHAVAGVLVPRARHEERLGRTEADLALDVRPASPQDLGLFAAYGEPPAADPLRGVEIREIAAGIHAVLLTEREVKSFVVERSDHLAVFETPFDAQAATAILAAAARVAPDKPVRYVGFSHEHRHTSGGVPAFLRAGATLIGTEETVAFAEDLMGLQHRGTPDGPPAAAAPRVASLLVTDRLDLPDEANPIVVYNVGRTNPTDPSSFAPDNFVRHDYLLFYFPRGGVLLNGCLSTFHQDEEPVASDRQEALLATLRDLGVTPNLLCSAMDTQDRFDVTPADLEAAVAKRLRLKPLTDELEAMGAGRLAAGADSLAAVCRERELGAEWFDGKAQRILLQDAARALAWSTLTTRTWPGSPLGWLRLSEAEEALGRTAAALDFARKAAVLDAKDEDLRERVSRLEKLIAPK
ncbi:MAG: MBL fold metallo-hydrolase [bacterium]|nr:MBL fold metallo-hydrolase [bacterium]